jgi:hypothetical protein
MCVMQMFFLLKYFFCSLIGVTTDFRCVDASLLNKTTTTTATASAIIIIEATIFIGLIT